MKRIQMNTMWRNWLLAGLACLVVSPVWAQDDDPNDAVVQMIVGLINDADNDMRTLGLQQIREQVPGAAATKKFAAMLPKLDADRQAALLEALGDRGDVAAHPAAVEMLKSEQLQVRAAALQAIGALGSAADVPRLTEKTASVFNSETSAARQSLIRLRGEGVNEAIIAAIADSEPGIRVVLLDVLAGRNATDATETVLKYAEDEDTTVRIAALEAIRSLALESHAGAIVKLLKAARDDAERGKAELALLVVCSRGKQQCAGAVIEGMADADAPSRALLLHALARAGGADALDAVMARLKDDDEGVRDEAVRMLAIWRDPAVVEHLQKIAGAPEKPLYQTLAIRGLVRLARPQEEEPANVQILTEAMKLAVRPQEKRLVLGALGAAATLEALDLATASLDEAELVEEAGFAAVTIAEKIEDGDKDKIRAAMEKVRKNAKSPMVLERAKKVLESLQRFVEPG